MLFARKLKPDRDFLGPLQPVVILFFCAIFYLVSGLQATTVFLGSVFLVYAAFSILILYRMRSPGYLIVTLYQLFAAAFIFSIPKGIETNGNFVLTKIFIMLMLGSGAATWFFIISKRMKWRGREVLEMAAGPIEETSSGFTTRPMPIPRQEYSKHQLLSFAEFASYHLISYVWEQDDRLVFIPIKGGKLYRYFLRLKNDYSDETYVAFSLDGQVSVNISERDYLDFREDYSFDLLCESLGNLYIEFLDQYLKGEGMMIINRMNQMGFGIFS